jgi:hypothetical protein
LSEYTARPWAENRGTGHHQTVREQLPAIHTSHGAVLHALRDVEMTVNLAIRVIAGERPG